MRRFAARMTPAHHHHINVMFHVKPYFPMQNEEKTSSSSSSMSVAPIR
jgi:hypothetical protein